MIVCESDDRLRRNWYADKVRQWPSQWPEFFAVNSVENRKCANCPTVSPFVGDDVGSAPPFPVLTFEDEDQPYGWPEIDA